MPTQVGIGFSQQTNTPLATQEALQEALKQLNDNQPSFAMIVNTAHYAPQEILKITQKIIPNTCLIGCSTAGIILPNCVVDRGIGIFALSTDELKIETGYVTHLPMQNMLSAGTTFGNNIAPRFGLQQRKLFLFLMDGLLHDTEGLCQGLKHQLGNILPIVGAKSCDSFRFQETWQYDQDKVFSQGAVGALFNGYSKTALSCKHGWRPLGKPRNIDEMEGRVLKSIDGQPALNLYKEFFPEDFASLKDSGLNQLKIRYPLGIKIPGKNKGYLLRNITHALDDGSLVCQDNLIAKAPVHIMIGNTDACLEAAEEAAQDIKEQLSGQKPKFILIMDSLLRYKILGRSAYQEIRMIKNILGIDVPVFGMYANGEISSTQVKDHLTKTFLQNGSIAIAAIA